MTDEINPVKSEWMRIKGINEARTYTMNGRFLESNWEQKDHVQVQTSLKVVMQVDNMAKCPLFCWDIEYTRREVMLQFHKTLVRQQLEYCIQFWAPHYRCDTVGEGAGKILPEI